MLRCVFLFLLIPHIVFAWGDIGHRAIGELAERQLTPKAKEQVQKLLGRDNMADASLWADIVRSNPKYDFQSKWHYTNLKDGQLSKKSNKQNQEDVVWAIDLMVNILKDQGSHPKVVDKTHALKLLIHFVEDLHQPLHAGRKVDRGGSLLYVNFFDQTYNLHSVWDSGLIQRLGLSYTELVDYLQRHYQGIEVKQLSPEYWASESAKLLSFVYFFDNIQFEGTPPLVLHQELLKKYPKILNRRKSKNKKPYLHFRYLNRTLPIALKRLYEASIRLANLLNTLFS